MVQGYLIFHLNLAFSSIKTEARPEVIHECYWPLLRLAESTGITIGIELTGWTLQQIQLLDPLWVQRFRQLLQSNQCELIGSGWSQIIGPLVPYEVNFWNQKLGMDAYQGKLGVTPKLALVNEMAFSTGMVDIYAEAGYKGFIMDRDNVRLALGLGHTHLSTTPTHALGCGSQSLPVLWSDSILFQRLQRVVHGDIPVSEYMEYVKQRADQDHAVLHIYCNDAEIFDFRPGRFATESRFHSEGEWERLERICRRLKEDLDINWLSPSQAFQIQAATSKPNSCRLTSVSQPIPVKKQAKYNINRWAVTGRDDLWLNTSCHQIHQELMRGGDTSRESWKALCELWVSDLRTHITSDRWDQSVKRVAEIRHGLGMDNRASEVKHSDPSKQDLSEISLPKSVQIDQDEGTADKVMVTIENILATRKSKLEIDPKQSTPSFDVVSNPEFLKEGAAVNDFLKPDRIVIGTQSERAKTIMSELYEPFNRNHDRTIFMDVRSAELTKYAANAMLATKISFMNEMANLAERLGADVEQVRKGIGADPRIGYQFIYPGCGYGGSCFPKDVQALAHTAKKIGYDAQLLRAVEDVNNRQKTSLFAKLVQHFGSQSALKGKTIAVWGLAFKPNTDDMRDAPSRTLMEALWQAGARVQAFDPVAMKEAAHIYNQQPHLRLFDDQYEVLAGADALVICTEWQQFRAPDFTEMSRRMGSKIIVDGRNLYHLKKMKEDGWVYLSVGRNI